MKLYLTWASGFIGSHVLRAALDEGWQVSVPRLPTNRLAIADLGSRVAVRDVHGGAAGASWRPDAAIHLAWIADPPTYLTSHENLTCMVQSLDILRALVGLGCSRVVMAGSAAEYRPTDAALTENSAVQPQTLYAACKVAMSMIGQQLTAPSPTAFIWARIFHAFGPLEHRQRLIPSLINTLLDGRPFAASTGEQRRDFLYVDDVATAFLRLAAAGERGIYNVSSGRPATVRDVITTVAAQLGRGDLVQFGTIPLRSWDPSSLYGANDRLRALGWQPDRSLADGLRHTIDWWVGERERASS